MKGKYENVNLTFEIDIIREGNCIFNYILIWAFDKYEILGILQERPYSCLTLPTLKAVWKE
jgi:hypothetical protein